jgi:hypothetical protein
LRSGVRSSFSILLQKFSATIFLGSTCRRISTHERWD